MTRSLTLSVALGGFVLAQATLAVAQPFPSGGSPNPNMTAPSGARPRAPVANPAPAPAPRLVAPGAPNAPSASPGSADQSAPSPSSAPMPGTATGGGPRAVSVARTVTIPRCTVFVDAAAPARGAGTAQSPHKTIEAAVAAATPGAVICVAEGVYQEQIKPGEKFFIFAGGFQRGTNFTVRDSSRYVSKAQGQGQSGSFIRYEDPGPKDNQLTAIDGFEITGYAQAVVRDIYYSQRFDLTNNHIHGNRCGDDIAGAGAAFNNISGYIQGNVFRNNSCGRGGALFVQDTAQQNTVVIANNLVDDNHGTEPTASHGGAVYLFGKTLTVTGNLFTNNSVTQWGGALYVGAWTEGNNFTTAAMSWNVYRGNRAGNGGGGFFCDDGATCINEHELYDRNCGSNVYVDGGSGKSGPTTARFSYITVANALAVGCGAPGAGLRIDKNGSGPDNYSFTNSLFWGNAPGQDIVMTCDTACDLLKVEVTHSMVQSNYLNQGKGDIVFGAGIMASVDPLFAAPQLGDFHLKSAAGRWTPAGYVRDAVTSPALGQANPASPADKNPPRAGKRNELGAYGNSSEASFTQ